MLKYVLLAVALCASAHAATKLTVTPAPGSHTVTLSCTASPTQGVTYSLYRTGAAGSCGVKPENQKGAAACSFTDSTVNNGADYFYTVTAVGTGGESTCTNEVHVQVPVPPLPPSTLQGSVN